MISVVKVISTEVNTLSRRIVKFLRLGNRDVQTSVQAAPAGVDSNPIKDMMALYSPTGDKGKTVIIGYINQNQVAGPGEHRVFSVNSQGQVQTYIWLKNDGVMEVGGNTDFMVRFSNLKEGFDQLKQDFNNFLTHTHPGDSTPPAPPVNPSTASIDAAKIETIKTG